MDFFESIKYTCYVPIARRIFSDAIITILSCIFMFQVYILYSISYTHPLYILKIRNRHLTSFMMLRCETRDWSTSSFFDGVTLSPFFIFGLDFFVVRLHGANGPSAPAGVKLVFENRLDGDGLVWAVYDKLAQVSSVVGIANPQNPSQQRILVRRVRQTGQVLTIHRQICHLALKSAPYLKAAQKILSRVSKLPLI